MPTVLYWVGVVFGLFMAYVTIGLVCIRWIDWIEGQEKHRNAKDDHFARCFFGLFWPIMFPAVLFPQMVEAVTYLCDCVFVFFFNRSKADVLRDEDKGPSKGRGYWNEGA